MKQLEKIFEDINILISIDFLKKKDQNIEN